MPNEDGVVLKNLCPSLKKKIIIKKMMLSVNHQYRIIFLQHQMEYSFLCKTGTYTRRVYVINYLFKTCQLTHLD